MVRKTNARVTNQKQMAKYLSDKYHSLEYEDVIDIFEAFEKLLEEKFCTGKSILIKHFGEFTTKIMSEKITKDWKKNSRTKPEMIVPIFKPARKLRNFINKED